MRLRTIKGSSVSDALRQVQEELGPNALVLETRTGEDSTEVIAADVEREEPAEGLMRLRAELALLRRELAQRGAREVQAVPAPATSGDAPAVQPHLVKVAARLREQEVHPQLVERVLKMLESAARSGGGPIDPRSSEFCRNAVAGLIPGIPASVAKKVRCYAFVGPPGAGKTTTIAKLAEQSRGAGDRSFGIITLDGDRPGAAELLAASAGRLGFPYAVVRGPDDILSVIDRLGNPKTVLIDTAGHGFRENAALVALRERLRMPHQVAVHLVLPASMESRALRATAGAFSRLGPASLVFTKIDETQVLGNLLNLPVALSLPVAALGHGPSIRGDLARATRKLIAELVLGRRTTNLEGARK